MKSIKENTDQFAARLIMMVLLPGFFLLLGEKGAASTNNQQNCQVTYIGESHLVQAEIAPPVKLPGFYPSASDCDFQPKLSTNNFAVIQLNFSALNRVHYNQSRQKFNSVKPELNYILLHKHTTANTDELPAYLS